MTRDNRLTRTTGRLAAEVARISIRGQMGPVRETELARLTGARR